MSYYPAGQQPQAPPYQPAQNTLVPVSSFYPPPPPGLSPSTTYAGPPLPPRPVGGPPRLAQASNMNFPPPPRSPNRPPELPPRPQQQPFGQQPYGRPYGQPSGQPNYAQPVYGQPAPQQGAYQSSYGNQQQSPSYTPTRYFVQAPQQPEAYATTSATTQAPLNSYAPGTYPPPPPSPYAQQPAVAGVQNPPVYQQPLTTCTVQRPAAVSYAPPTTAPVAGPTPPYQAMPSVTTTGVQPINVSQPGQPQASRPLPAQAPVSSLAGQSPVSPPPQTSSPGTVNEVNSLLSSMTISPQTPGRPAVTSPNTNPPVGASVPQSFYATQQYVTTANPAELGSESSQGQPPPTPAIPEPHYIGFHGPVRTATGEMVATVVGPLQPPDFLSRPPDPQPQTQPPQVQPQTAQTPQPTVAPLDRSSIPVAARGGPPPALKDCLTSPVKFSTTWYVHPQAADGIICSNCYVKYIWPSQFRDQFVEMTSDDGRPRRCRFNCPRITEDLFGKAKSMGNIQPVLDFILKRSPIKDCAGLGGAVGGQGIKWYRPINNAVENMVVCEACYEDNIVGTSLARYFERAHEQSDNETWGCDLAVPFVSKQFEICKTTGDWTTFVSETKARMTMPACAKLVPTVRGSRKWFSPVNGPEDTLLCVACYCDHILTTGEESKWKPVDEIFGTILTPTCLFGLYPVIVSMTCAEAAKDWSIFWRAFQKMNFEEPFCSPNGTKTSHWYTLPSQPPGFQLCGACYHGILVPLEITSYFVPMSRPPDPNTATLCCLNTKAPRFVDYTDRLIETRMKNSPASLLAYANKYGIVPRCPRDVDCSGRSWYGWQDCVICTECYVDFVHGTALDKTNKMQLRGSQLQQAQICDMYSPRMRKLYTEACMRDDPSEMRAFNNKRRLVYWQTMPRVRTMLAEQLMQASTANMKMVQGVLYTGIGNLEANTSTNPDRYEYSQVGVGSGFHNQMELDGARLMQEGQAMSLQVTNVGRIMSVGMLESQWKQVE